MLKTFITFVSGSKEKAGSNIKWVKSEIFCLALKILKNQANSVSIITIIRSLSIKCNFMRVRVYKMEDEYFVIPCVNCHYFRHVSFNVYNEK